MKTIGSDKDGITQISVNALISLHVKGEILKEIRIYSTGPADTVCEFEFEGNKIYEASGFSIGYGGEGPHGLWTAIRTFCPNKISGDFWKTQISGLSQGHWRWTPNGGFVTF